MPEGALGYTRKPPLPRRHHGFALFRPRVEPGLCAASLGAEKQQIGL
jgi:hypothetical protein